MSNDKMWDNSSLQKEIVWDNQTLPGMSEEELLTTEWNRRGHKNSPDHIRRTSEGIRKAFERGVYEAKHRSQQKPLFDPDDKEWPSAREAAAVWFPHLSPFYGSRRVRNLCNAQRLGWRYK